MNILNLISRYIKPRYKSNCQIVSGFFILYSTYLLSQLSVIYIIIGNFIKTGYFNWVVFFCDYLGIFYNLYNDH